MLLQLIQQPSNGLYIFFALVFSSDKDIIKVDNYKNVKLFSQDLIDITLNRGWYISQSKRYDLIFKMIIMSFEGRLLFISFPNFHLMVGMSQIKLGKLLNPS